jgi:hypothetical protein
MSDCCNPKCDKMATPQSRGQKGASTCGSGECKRYRKNIYPRVEAARKAAIEARERERMQLQEAKKEGAEKERHLRTEVALLENQLKEAKNTAMISVNQAERKRAEDQVTIHELKKQRKRKETDHQIDLLAAIAVRELVHTQSTSYPNTTTPREAIFVRAQGRVLAYKMNVLACLESQSAPADKLVLEEFLSRANLDILAAVTRIPRLRERVLDGDIVSLQGMAVFFCSSGTKPGFGKDGKDQDIMRLFAENVPEDLRMCIPVEGMYNYIAGQVENASVATLQAFRAHRTKHSQQKSAFESTFATDDCLVLWGDARFEKGKPLPTVREVKVLKRSAYLKTDCTRELAARKIKMDNKATVAQMRAKLLEIKDYTSLVQHERVEYHTRKISASQNSICAPPGWYYEEEGKAFFNAF